MREYLFEILTTKQPAQELRAFGIASFLAERHDRVYGGLLHELRAVLLKRQRIVLAAEVLAALLSAGAIMLLVWFVTSGRMSLSTRRFSGGRDDPARVRACTGSPAAQPGSMRTRCTSRTTSTSSRRRLSCRRIGRNGQSAESRGR